MILLRIYALMWVLVLAAAGGLYSTGSFNELALTIFGFLSSTLLVAGFVAVLPAWMNHHFAPRTYSPDRLARIARRRQAVKTRTAKNINGGFRNVS